MYPGRVPQVWDCDNVTMSLSEVCSLCDTDAITPLDVLVEDSIVAQVRNMRLFSGTFPQLFFKSFTK